MARNVRSGVSLSAAAMLLAVLAGSPWAQSNAVSAAEPGVSPTAATVKGVRLFTCGHSFHVWVYRLLGEMADAAGIKDHQGVGLSSIGGSRVIQHWDVPDAKNEAKAALSAGKVDVLTLSPIWFPDEGIAKLARLGFEHNPAIRVTVQEYWLPNDTYEPIYPLDVRKGINHNDTNLKELRKNQTNYLRDVDDCARGINQQLGKDVLFVVPVGQAALALREKIVAGQAPGLKMQWDLFRDSWGHPQAPLMVLSGYCHFATIYRRSPVGLAVPEVLTKYRRLTTDVSLRKPGWRPSADDVAKSEALTSQEAQDLNRLLQELAWQAVTHHPMSGVTAK